MRSILMSIKPKYCEFIANGLKTLEIRKTKPKIKPPFKVYIYCTLNGAPTHPSRYAWKKDKTGKYREIYWNGKVVGEFVCDAIYELAPLNHYPRECGDGAAEKDSCLTREQIVRYLKGKGWGWHISEVKIYDEPKELSEFHRPCTPQCTYYDECGCGANVEECLFGITTPPQSWRYVEEL